MVILIIILIIGFLLILTNYNPISMFFRSTIRRIYALRQAEKYIIDTFPIYTLKNDNVALIYDDRKLEMLCIDNDTNKHTMVTKKDYEQRVDKNVNDYIRSNFDDICSIFNEKTTYKYIINYMEWNLNTYYLEDDSDQENYTKEQMDDSDKLLEQKYNQYMNKYPENKPNLYQKQYTPPTEPIDINSASEKELAKLPGISIILAKKIIDYRNLNNGFKSKYEFYFKMNIKLHFQTQIDHLITVNEFEWEEGNIDNNERTIDI